MNVTSTVVDEITIKTLTPYREIDENYGRKIGLDENTITKYNEELNKPLVPKDQSNRDFIEAFLKWHNDINPEKGRSFEEYSKYPNDPYYSLWRIGAYIDEQLNKNKEPNEVANPLTNLFHNAAKMFQNTHDDEAYEQLLVLGGKAETIYKIYRKVREFKKKFKNVIDAVRVRETEQYT